jgi:cysteine desulfurase
MVKDTVMTAPARRVYLDHSATTPTDLRVVEAMLPYFHEVYGNSSSTHRVGQAAEQAVDDARETIARILNCKPAEIVFTSGGTESDNLAIRGAAWTKKYAGEGVHLVSSFVEHSAVIKTLGQLTILMGFNHTLVPVDHVAMIAAEDFASACWADTTLASVIYANNEVGTIMPIPQLAALAHERGILFHTDAVQAAGQLTLDVQALDVDMMSLSAHKFYGPKGVGLLYVREGIDLVPSQSGGSHEEGRRAGTMNTPAIVGMAKALQLAYEEIGERTAHYQTLRDALIDGILDRVPEAQLTGHPELRLPSHASFVFDGIDGNLLLLHLDMKGIAASSASACKTGNPEPSDVLLAMGYSNDLSGSGLRLTVGKDTTKEDVEYAVVTVAETVEKLLRLGQTYI